MMQISTKTPLYAQVKKALDSQNAALTYYETPLLKEILILTLSKHIQDFPAAVIGSLLKDISYLYQNQDYRTVALYLHSLYTGKPFSPADLTPPLGMHKIGKKLYENRVQQGERKRTVQVSTLEDIFSQKEKGVFYFAKNVHGEKTLQALDALSSGHIASFIEAQLDLPGYFSLVRKGLIKYIQLSDGSYIVTKRNNPDKQGRFESEQRNVTEIARRLNLDANNERPIDATTRLSLIEPSLVIASPSEEVFYSVADLKPGKTLEEILIKEKDKKKRYFHFNNLKKILELLYAHHILWTDMAPRNILVEEGPNDFVKYHILDFEKTHLLDHLPTHKEREEHCRGPMCVEEFGAICSLEEVLYIFGQYFNPTKWDTSISAPVPFQKPKRELEALFAGRSKKDWTFGDYNTLEQHVLKVRFPIGDVYSSDVVFPVHANFKIDHYLGPDYDRKLTEVFMDAHTHKMLKETARMISQALTHLDNRMLINDFEAILKGTAYLEKTVDSRELITLKDAVDSLYAARHTKKTFDVISLKLEEL